MKTIFRNSTGAVPVVGDASAGALAQRGRVVVGRAAAQRADPQLAALRRQHVRRGAPAALPL